MWAFKGKSEPAFNWKLYEHKKTIFVIWLEMEKY